MTYPGAPGNFVPRDTSDQGRRLKDLEDAVRRIEANALGRNGLTFYDSVSGTYLPISQLAFGLVADSTAGTFSTTANSTWHDGTGDSPLTVEVTTGRLVVTVSAVLYSSLSSSNAVLSYDIAGPTPIGPDNQRALVAPAMTGAAAYLGGSYRYAHTDLAPGTYTVKLQYRGDLYGGSDTVFFENRSLVLEPF